MKSFLFGALATVALVTPAMAQTPAQGAGRWMQPQTRADVERMAQARFAERDTNDDGSLSQEEFVASARNATAASAAFARMDTDHDGRISQAEAVANALKRFDAVDTNHDGTVTPEERQAAMQVRAERMARGDAMPDAPPPPAG